MRDRICVSLPILLLLLTLGLTAVLMVCGYVGEGFELVLTGVFPEGVGLSVELYFENEEVGVQTRLSAGESRTVTPHPLSKQAVHDISGYRGAYPNIVGFEALPERMRRALIADQTLDMSYAHSRESQIIPFDNGFELYFIDRSDDTVKRITYMGTLEKSVEALAKYRFDGREVDWFSVEDGLVMFAVSDEAYSYLAFIEDGVLHEQRFERLSENDIIRSRLTNGVVVYRRGTRGDKEEFLGGETHWLALDRESGEVVFSAYSDINGDPLYTSVYDPLEQLFDAYYDGSRLWILDRSCYSLMPHSGMRGRHEVASLFNRYGAALAGYMVTLVCIEPDGTSRVSHPYTAGVAVDYKLHLRVGFIED